MVYVVFETLLCVLLKKKDDNKMDHQLGWCGGTLRQVYFTVVGWWWFSFSKVYKAVWIESKTMPMIVPLLDQAPMLLMLLFPNTFCISCWGVILKCIVAKLKHSIKMKLWTDFEKPDASLLAQDLVDVVFLKDKRVFMMRSNLKAVQA